MVKILTLLLFISNTLMYSQDSTNHNVTPKDISSVKHNSLNELKKDIENLTENPDFKNSHIGISVYSLDNSEYFYRFNDSKNFIPASTIKLITTASALQYLGKDFVFSTKIFLDGNLKTSGEFSGNIIIRGSGDPTISKYYDNNPEKIFSKWADIIDSIGINSITGYIIGDDSYMDNEFYAPGWAWDDVIYPYSAQVNSIAVNDNCIDVVITQGDTIGESADISFFPKNSYIRFINNIKTGHLNSISEINIFREQGANIIELQGVIPFDTTKLFSIQKRITIDNPTLFMLNIFRESLEARQIRFRGALLDIDDWNEDLSYLNLEPIIIHESKPLSEIIQIINKESHNLSAELLLKTIGKETTGKGTFEAGIEKLKDFLEIAGISPENMVIVDGSGLSRFNLMSPRYQINLLSWIYRSDYKKELIETFALPGEKGTLERRLRRSLAEKSVIAKTGSMNNIDNIMGFVKTRDGETLAFSIMIQNFTVPSSLARNLQDLILMRLASFSRN